MKPVELPDDTQETLKEATRKAVKNAGGLLPVSALWGVSHQAVQATYSMNVEHMDRTTSLQRFVATVAFSGDVEPLQIIAKLFGKKLVDECHGEASQEAVWSSLNAIKGMGMASAILAEAAGDNTITKEEAVKCLRELSVAEQQIADCRETLTAIITR